MAEWWTVTFNDNTSEMTYGDLRVDDGVLWVVERYGVTR